MATLKEHVYAIKGIINKGVASDDSRFSNRRIAHYLKQSRGLLIKRKLDKKKYISKLNYQRICIPLELVTYGDCSCISDAFPDCKILRSTCELPAVLTNKYKSTLIIRAIDGTILSETSITKSKLKAYSLSQKTPKTGWFTEDNRLFVLYNEDITAVIGVALYEDPEEVSSFCTCSDNGSSATTPCYDVHNDEYPIDIELVLPMYDLTLKLMREAYQYAEDNEDNARSVQVVNEKE